MPTYRLHYFPESGNSYKLALMRYAPASPRWGELRAS